MKICIYGEPLTVYTSGNPVRGMITELIKTRPNDDFIIVLRRGTREFKDYFEELNRFKNTRIIYLRTSRKVSNLKAVFNLKSYNKLNIDADVCISPGNPDYFAGFRGKQINFLADLSSIRNPKFSSQKWHGKRIQKNILKFGVKYADKIICISKFTKNDLTNLYPQYSDKYDVIYNGISDFWFDTDFIDNRPASDFKKQHGNYFIWWGAISPRKNLTRLLKAYQSLLPENALPELLFIGEFIFKDPELSNLIKELKNHIYVIPFQEFKILKGYISESKGLVFPSLYEGFGLPVIEAFSLGKAVLHSNVTSLPEVAGGLGIEVDPYSVESIKKGLLQLSKNTDTDASKKKDYAALFTYKKAAKKLSKLINEVYGK